MVIGPDGCGFDMRSPSEMEADDARRESYEAAHAPRMAVTSRIRRVAQPPDGYLPLSLFDEVRLADPVPLYAFEDVPADVTGLAVDYLSRVARGVPALNDAAERMVAFAALARRYPEAKLVFSGGSAALEPGEAVEADAVRLTLVDLGIDMQRMIFERRSRNTAENAAFTRQLVDPAPGSRWLLVTSAFHMPRAVGCFRGADFPVEAYPVDYRTVSPRALDGGFTRVAQGLDLTDLVAKEWLGLLAYYLSGRIPALFPAPNPVGAAS